MTDGPSSADDEEMPERRAKKRKGRPARPVIRDDGKRYESAGVAAIENGCDAKTIRRAIKMGTKVNGHAFAFDEAKRETDEKRDDGQGDGAERLLDAGACQGDRDSAIDDRPLPERGEAEEGLRAEAVGDPGHGQGETLREHAVNFATKCPMKFNNLRDGDAYCDENCAWILKQSGYWLCSVPMLAAKTLDGVVLWPSLIDVAVQFNVEQAADDDREN